jgi:hypothetical protein
MTLTIEPYQETLKQEWDNLIDSSVNGTFMHTRRFLSYHNEKFEDLSTVILDNDSNLVGIFACAKDLLNPYLVTSHPGLTYGGIVHNGTIRSDVMTSVMRMLLAYYKDKGFNSLKYKAVPFIYHKIISSDDLYTVFQLGGKTFRIDLSATIDLTKAVQLSHGRQSDIKKAISSGVTISSDWNNVSHYWKALEINLHLHNAVPTHNVNEILALKSLFETNIELICAIYNNKVVAGTLLFITNTAVHTQYIGSIDPGRKLGAVSLVIDAAIKRASQLGVRYFDFGISTEMEGRILNSTLQNFKRSFGAGSTIYEQFIMDL